MAFANDGQPFMLQFNSSVGKTGTIIEFNRGKLGAILSIYYLAMSAAMSDIYLILVGCFVGIFWKISIFLTGTIGHQ